MCVCVCEGGYISVWRCVRVQVRQSALMSSRVIDRAEYPSHRHSPRRECLNSPPSYVSTAPPPPALPPFPTPADGPWGMADRPDLDVDPDPLWIPPPSSSRETPSAPPSCRSTLGCCTAWSGPAVRSPRSPTRACQVGPTGRGDGDRPWKHKIHTFRQRHLDESYPHPRRVSTPTCLHHTSISH